MLVQKAQIYLPWIAVGLCVIVAVTYVVMRPAAESYDQCIARQSHPDMTEADRHAMLARCMDRTRTHRKVVGQ